MLRRTCAGRILLVLAAGIVLLGAVSAWANDLYVDPTGASGAYTSIQAAIDDAVDGDTIHVAAGTYNENVVVNKDNLILLGAQQSSAPTGAGRTGPESIIMGDGTASAVTISGQGVVLRGFEITGGAYAYPGEGGLEIAGHTYDHLIENNIIEGNAGIGIYVGAGCGHIVFRSNLIKDNAVSGWDVGGAMLQTGCYDNLFEGNEFIDNQHVAVLTYFNHPDYSFLMRPGDTWSGNRFIGNTFVPEADDGSLRYYGIAILKGKDTIIQGNHFADWYNAAITLQYYTENTLIRDNTIADCYIAVKLYTDDANTDIEKNNILRSIFYEVQNRGTVMVDASLNWWGDPNGPDLLKFGFDGSHNNVIFSPWLGAPFGTTPMLYIVDDVGPEPPSGYIATAIGAAGDEDTVYVRPGTYTPTAMITIDKDGLLLIGPQAGVDPRPSSGTTRTPGDPSTEAMIDGGGSLGTILYVNADDLVIEGLEIRNGTGDLVKAPSSYTQLRPIVRYNIVHDSSGDEGIQLKNVVDALIEYNYVYHTGGDGINIAESQGGTIQYNEVHDIYSPDAAIYVYGTPNVVIRGNLVYDVHNNDGIKLGSKNGADAGLSGGVISGNTVHDTAQDGITVYMSGITVEENEVYNSGSENGAVYLAWPITNILVARNVVRNNTLDPGKWGNPAGILIGTAVDAANVTIHYNSITGNTPYGLTNLTGTDVDATLNWWGDGEGPTHTSNTNTTTGDAVSDHVIFSPWLGTAPDGDPATPGVQITGPMLIIVDDIGPAPAGGYLNAAIAGANSADLPGRDTIEVRPGSYDASEPITDPAELVSTGCTGTTTLNGPITINAPNVLLGRLRQGFTINGPITIGAGIDASTIHINWNDIYDLVTNNGTGWLDATFNYWGDDGPDTVGLVRTYPYLPDTSCTIIGYIDEFDLTPLAAIGYAYLLGLGTSDRDALLVARLMEAFGFSESEAMEIIDEYGAFLVGRALSWSMGDYDEFMVQLLGYTLGGGGGGGLTEGELQTFTIGETVPLVLELLNPITGEVIDDAIVSYTVSRALDSGIQEIVLFGAMPFDSDLGAYSLDLDTSSLEPGLYDIWLGSDDGRTHHYQIELTE